MTDKYPNSLMCAEAIENDEMCGLTLYPINKIFSDHEFNCRIEQVTPMDVIDLAKSIAQKGLLAPIILRPCGEFDTDPKDYDHVIVAGYRRYQAYRVNNHPVIPAILRQGKKKDSYSIDNFIENLKRKDLNLLEQARSIERLYNAGMSRNAIANELNVSDGWVQVRCMILDLQPVVQAEVATGILTTTHIRKLYSIKDIEQQIAVAVEIKKARQRGEGTSKNVTKILEKEEKPRAMTKKRRTVTEIREMMEVLYETFGSHGLQNRLLGWTAGDVANFEVYHDIKEEAREAGICFEIPDFSHD
ncbi:MAG: hypothetical protein DRR06_13475 [Gammaproteobacteria bacterium]|nr:MAG: hypothetical protein DRR06_13475 [Gammaproteobacteria bacterium]